MSLRQNLLHVRSHVVFFAALLVAASLVYFLEGLQPGPLVSSAQAHTARPPVSLTAEDMAHARIAWSYFEKNYQPSTGLCNSVDGYPAAAAWDMGSYLLALVAARELTLIDNSTFDVRVQQLLASLARAETFQGILPNKSYNTASLQMVDYNNQPRPQGIGWSALDVGRLLIALHVVQRNYAIHTAAVNRILERWKLTEAVQGGELFGARMEDDKVVRNQEGRLGYEQYAARGYLLYGLDAWRAANWERWRETVQVNGVSVPYDRRDPKQYTAQNFVVSEPYLMIGLEFGLDDYARTAAQSVLGAQEARFRKEGILTSVSESNLDKAPYFSYFCVYSGGRQWVCVNESGPIGNEFRTFNTSAAFGWYALLPGTYTQKLVDEARTLADPARGFYAGRYEADNKLNQVLTCNGNALILESLFYRERGPMVKTYR